MEKNKINLHMLSKKLEPFGEGKECLPHHLYARRLGERKNRLQGLWRGWGRQRGKGKGMFSFVEFLNYFIVFSNRNLKK